MTDKIYGMFDSIEPDKSRWDREGRVLPTTQLGNTGKDFVPAKELLNLAHQKGLIRTQLEVVQLDPANGEAFVRATVFFADGTMFEGLGDATPNNLNKMTKTAYFRMAETRAISRALGQALNIDTNAAEEIHLDESESAPRSTGARNSYRGNTQPARAAASDDDGEDWS